MSVILLIIPMNYKEILEEIHEEVRPLLGKGKSATYIPQLANRDPSSFGMAVQAIGGESFSAGDAGELFTVQSISKVLTLSLAFSKVGEQLWERVGIEPSGNPFNSLVQLEYEKGKPRNPLINAGALVVSDILAAQFKDPKSGLLDFIGELAGENIMYNADIVRSEQAWGHVNRAMVNDMKVHDNIENPTESVLDFYFHQCSIEMNCIQLAKTFLYLANHGVIPHNDRRVHTPSQSKRLMAIMLTCGLYDEAGEFAFRVGLPGKSGVGGGIIAIIPGQMSIAVWSPGLNEHGNSLAGIMALELFTTKTGMSIF